MVKFTSVELRQTSTRSGSCTQIWVSGKDGGWEFQQSKGYVFAVSGVLVVQDSLTNAPVAVLRDEQALSDYCAQRFGVRP